jgi:hypothetical protein
MLIEDFIIFVFYCIDERVKKIGNFRSRGFDPKLSDSEVISMEIVGEFLGFDTDKGIWEYFCREWRDWFPNLTSRSTFARQAANIWKLKQLLQQQLFAEMNDSLDCIRIVDGFPISVCHFARARRGACFKGEAGYGRCASKNQVYYGFKGHLLITASGVISAFAVTSANIEEHRVIEELSESFKGLIIGDKGFISEALKGRLKKKGIDLQTPLKKNMKDDRNQRFVSKIKSLRRIVETVIAQLIHRFHFTKVWARDQWHLISRLSRKLLTHTLGVFLNRKIGRSPIKFDGLLSA